MSPRVQNVPFKHTQNKLSESKLTDLLVRRCQFTVSNWVSHCKWYFCSNNQTILLLSTEQGKNNSLHHWFISFLWKASWLREEWLIPLTLTSLQSLHTFILRGGDYESTGWRTILLAPGLWWITIWGYLVSLAWLETTAPYPCSCLMETSLQYGERPWLKGRQTCFPVWFKSCN